MSKSKMIVRTTFIDRACHWTVVICFFLVALSGISFFFPTLQWLTETFGTPQMGRILHPFFGVLIFVVLMFMFVRFVHHNIPDKQDIPWLKGIVEVLKGNEHKVAKVGKYNAGQKMMFWTIMSMIFVLLVTGVIIFTVINYGLTYIGVNPYWQYIIKGAIIIFAVALDSLKYSRKK